MSVEIIGMAEYEILMKAQKGNEANLRGLSKHHFHPLFIELITQQVDPKKDLVQLDRVRNFKEFPESQGIYFCCRRVSLDSPLIEVWYVGKARNFRIRWSRHHKIQALKDIQNVIVVCVPFNNYSNDNLIFVEQVYINMLEPSFNDISKPERHLRCVS